MDIPTIITGLFMLAMGALCLLYAWLIFCLIDLVPELSTKWFTLDDLVGKGHSRFACRCNLTVLYYEGMLYARPLDCSNDEPRIVDVILNISRFEFRLVIRMPRRREKEVHSLEPAWQRAK